MLEIRLAELPRYHELRNQPLVGVFYHNVNSKVRQEVTPAFGIAKCTYNQLARCWTDNDIFIRVFND